MPSSTSERKCVLPNTGAGTGGEYIVSTGDQEKWCRQQGGDVVPGSTGDGSGRQPMSALLVESYVSAPTQPQPAVTERVLLHPLCSVRRKAPGAGLMAGLYSLNEDFSADLAEIAESDEALKQRMFSLFLTMSALASHALQLEDEGATTIVSVSAELVEDARALGAAVMDRTSNERLVETIESLLEQAEQLVGVPVSDLIQTIGELSTAD